LHASARLIDGNAIGQAMRTELGGEIAALKAQGVTPGLAAVLVGERPATKPVCTTKRSTGRPT
jgi:methylenetetrahydrofolate dehydrogenase (NADP+)/methenyltetrahydrofolate cyclohydrolase